MWLVWLIPNQYAYDGPLSQYLDDEKENRAITFVFFETVRQTSEESLDQVPEFKSRI